MHNTRRYYAYVSLHQGTNGDVEMAHFSAISKDRLASCDDRLQQLFNEVIKHFDCRIIEGHRTNAKHQQYLAQKASRRVDSLHLRTPSLAVDVAPYPIDWEDLNRFRYFGGFVKGIAAMLNIPIIWGGDWDNDTQVNDQRFNDLIHFEIDESKVVT